MDDNDAVLNRPVGQLQPGHEGCSAEYIEEKTLVQLGSRTITSCLHDHTEPVYAYDAHGVCVGYHVADHCLCCDRIIRTPEFE